MKRFAAALGVAAVWFVPLAAQADPLDTPLPKAAWVKTIGSLRVEKYGQGAPALILVPGLGCGSWAFRDTVAREAPHHVIYSVTMAGTDGLPGGSDATLDNAEASIVTLIANEHLKMPVVVGHSLGGTLALRFGIDHGDLVKAIVSVDGTPVQPQFAMASAAERTAAAQQFYDVVSNQSQADYEKAEARYARPAQRSESGRRIRPRALPVGLAPAASKAKRSHGRNRADSRLAASQLSPLGHGDDEYGRPHQSLARLLSAITGRHAESHRHSGRQLTTLRHAGSTGRVSNGTRRILGRFAVTDVFRFSVSGSPRPEDPWGGRRKRGPAVLSSRRLLY
jgi:pimeloyl-ACP methyl ester carboxylesterase